MVVFIGVNVCNIILGTIIFFRLSIKKSQLDAGIVGGEGKHPTGSNGIYFENALTVTV
jgi:hypothetical protein